MRKGSNMGTFLEKRVIIPEGVLMQEVSGEAVLLNLKNEHYYGLDDVGTRMWQVLTEAASVGAAARQLLAEYDVDEATLHHDLKQLIMALEENGLLRLEG
jgi:hypothetical protein